MGWHSQIVHFGALQGLCMVAKQGFFEGEIGGDQFAGPRAHLGLHVM